MLTLAKEQMRQGLQICIGIFHNIKAPHLEVVEEAKKYKIPFENFSCRGRFDMKTVLAIRKFIQQKEISIVHSHNYKSNFYALVSAIGIDVKKITTCHNWTTNKLKMNLYKNLDKLFMRKFDKVIAVSDVLKDEIVRSGIPSKKVSVIYNGVDVEKLQVACRKLQDENYGKKLRKQLGIKEDEKVIGTVGRLTEEKGHVYLLRAFKEVVSELPDTKLLIVGDGPLKESLKLKVQSLKLEKNVIFTGIRKDVPALLSIMDIFVLPSLDEGLPMAILEAMAAKIPVIATKVGAIPRVIENRENGILVSACSVQELTDALQTVLRGDELAKQMSDDGYHKVAEEFSSEKMAEKYCDLYEGLLADKNSD